MHVDHVMILYGNYVYVYIILWNHPIVYIFDLTCYLVLRL